MKNVNLTNESATHNQNVLQSNSSGLYKRLFESRVAKERGTAVTVVGAALVGDDNRPYFALECGHDWILVHIDEKCRVSQSDMAGLVSRQEPLAAAVERHNREWLDPWRVNYMEVWDKAETA